MMERCVIKDGKRLRLGYTTGSCAAAAAKAACWMLLSQRKKERICLEEIAKALEPGRVYAEPELNQVLLGFHEDYCTLRRDMISEGLLQRENGQYRLRG